jgi:hypothetical protein
MVPTLPSSYLEQFLNLLPGVVQFIDYGGERQGSHGHAGARDQQLARAHLTPVPFLGPVSAIASVVSTCLLLPDVTLPKKLHRFVPEEAYLGNHGRQVRTATNTTMTLCQQYLGTLTRISHARPQS